MTEQARKPISLTRIKRESDKAIMVEVTTGRGDHRNVWFPKGHVTVQGKVLWIAGWLYDKKAKELGGLISLDPGVAAQMIAE